MVIHLSPVQRMEVAPVKNTEPTHTITHRRLGTKAHVPLSGPVAGRLDEHLLARENGDIGHRLAAGDRDNIAIAFKTTPPIEGSDLSDQRVNYGALIIEPIRRGAEYGEEQAPLGPGGVVLEQDTDDQALHQP